MPQPQLSPIESRIIGVLVEKALTTPASYPLTLNALVAGCNQKNNRFPVTAYSASEIDETLSLLTVRGWVGNTDVGGRVLKWTHRLGVKLELTPAEVAVMAELLLRGPQQPGELRSRAARMHPIADQAALKEVLGGLMNREPPLAVRVGRRVGERADRYAQTVCPDQEQAPAEMPAAVTEGSDLPGPDVMERLALLESEVAALRGALEELGWTQEDESPD